jgi:hypothetical protein
MSIYSTTADCVLTQEFRIPWPSIQAAYVIEVMADVVFANSKMTA